LKKEANLTLKTALSLFWLWEYEYTCTTWMLILKPLGKV